MSQFLDGRPFNSQDYEKHDSRVKAAVTELVTGLYPNVTLQAGTQYGVDFFCTWINSKGEKIFYPVEVEAKDALVLPQDEAHLPVVRRKRTTLDLNDIHVARRKSKIFVETSSTFFLNFMFNYRYDFTVLLELNHNTPVIRKPTKDGEGKFFSCKGKAIRDVFIKVGGIWLKDEKKKYFNERLLNPTVLVPVY